MAHNKVVDAQHGDTATRGRWPRCAKQRAGKPDRIAFQTGKSSMWTSQRPERDRAKFPPGGSPLGTTAGGKPVETLPRPEVISPGALMGFRRGRRPAGWRVCRWGFR